MRFLIPQVWCPQTLTREQSVLWVKKCFPIIKILSSKLGARSKEDWFFEDFKKDHQTCTNISWLMLNIIHIDFLTISYELHIYKTIYIIITL